MNADPFDVEAQRRIEERIKQASSKESIRFSLEGLSDLSTACFLLCIDLRMIIVASLRDDVSAVEDILVWSRSPKFLYQL
jgi:hypothetical protein